MNRTYLFRFAISYDVHRRYIIYTTYIIIIFVFVRGGTSITSSMLACLSFAPFVFLGGGYRSNYTSPWYPIGALSIIWCPIYLIEQDILVGDSIESTVNIDIIRQIIS